MPLKRRRPDLALYEINNQYTHTHRSACSCLYFILQNQSPRSFRNSVICSSIIFDSGIGQRRTAPNQVINQVIHGGDQEKGTSPAGHQKSSYTKKIQLSEHKTIKHFMMATFPARWDFYAFSGQESAERKESVHVRYSSDTGFKMNNELRKFTIKNIGKHKKMHLAFKKTLPFKSLWFVVFFCVF